MSSMSVSFWRRTRLTSGFTGFGGVLLLFRPYWAKMRRVHDGRNRKGVR